MTLLSLVVSSLLITSVSARGGRGGGGGGGGGSNGGGSGTSVLAYSAQECYTLYLGSVETVSNETLPGTTGNPTAEGSYYYIKNNVGVFDASNVNYLTTRQPSVSWNMEVLDAYYNGSFTMTLTPPPANETYNCPSLKSQEIPNAYLRIGSQSRGNVSRADYGDKNSYYFQFGRSIFSENCPYTPNKAFVNFESSQDNLQSAQSWTLNQKKKGDKFELDGSLTGEKASYNNYFNYLANTTAFGADKDFPVRKCPPYFSMRTILANADAKMNATVTAETAEFTFSFVDPVQGWTVSGSFNGKHWAEGPRLLFDKDTITTDGQTKHVAPRKKSGSSSFLRDYGKYIYIAIGVVVLLFIIWFLWKCFSCVANCCGACFACCSKQKRADRSHNKWMKRQAELQRDVEYEPQQQDMAYKPAPQWGVTEVRH